jgi:hypothetical protein
MGPSRQARLVRELAADGSAFGRTPRKLGAWRGEPCDGRCVHDVGLAYTLCPQSAAGGGGSLHQIWPGRDTSVPQGAVREAGGETPGTPGAPENLATDSVNDIAAYVRAGQLRCLRRVCLRYRGPDAAFQPQLHPCGGASGACDRIHRRAARRSDFRPSGSQADVHVGVVLYGIWGFVYFAGLSTGSPTIVALVIALSFIPHGIQYGPQGALIAENFPARLRYSGSSIGYQLASIVGGGLAPFIATALLARDRSGYLVAGYLLACSVISLTAATFMREGTHPDISHDQ